MPVIRIPSKFLTGLVANPRPLGRPCMTWGHTLKRALKAFDIPTDFDEHNPAAQGKIATAPTASPIARFLPLN